MWQSEALSEGYGARCNRHSLPGSILLRSDLGNDLAADVTVRQPIQACRDLLRGDTSIGGRRTAPWMISATSSSAIIARSSCARLSPVVSAPQCDLVDRRGDRKGLQACQVGKTEKTR